MSDIQIIIDRFGGLTAMARALGHKHPTTIQGWRDTGGVPYWRVPEIEQAAKRAKISIPKIPQTKAQ